MTDLADLPQTMLYDHCRERCEQLVREGAYIPKANGKWDLLVTHQMAEQISRELPVSARARLSLPSILAMIRATLDVQQDTVDQGIRI